MDPAVLTKDAEPRKLLIAFDHPKRIVIHAPVISFKTCIGRSLHIIRITIARIIVAFTCVVNPTLWQHSLTIDRSVVEIRQSKSGEIANRAGHATLCSRKTKRINQNVGAMFHSKSAPNISRQNIVERDAIDDLENARNNVGERRAVVEDGSVWSRIGIRSEVFQHANGWAISEWSITGLSFVFDKYRIRVGIQISLVIFDKICTGSHVNEVSNSASIQAGASKLGRNVGDLIIDG